MKARPLTPAAAVVPREVLAHGVYRLSEACHRLGLGARVQAELVREGLPVVRVGRVLLVRGSDFANFVGQLGEQQRTSGNGQPAKEGE